MRDRAKEGPGRRHRYTRVKEAGLRRPLHACKESRVQSARYTRVRKDRFRLVGMWMVSRMREEGLKGNVTG